jgi:TolB protein
MHRWLAIGLLALFLTNGAVSTGAGEPAAEPAGVPAAAEAAPPAPEPLDPLYVRPFTEIGTGRNDGNPSWSHSGALISFERSMGDRKELHVLLADGRPVQTVYYLPAPPGGEMKFFFPGVVEDISYNAGYTWSPDDMSFLFMSNGGSGNYDIYRGNLGSDSFVRLTEHKEKDGQADWSPKGDVSVFVSGRTGKGDLYLLDLSTQVPARLTADNRENLYPQWSPDGKRIAFMSGSSENHDIIVLGELQGPARSRRALTTWPHDDIRPIWSPDGKKVAFYTNYDPAGDTHAWSIVVVNSDGSDPTEGEGLAARIVASNVVTDVERGPAWMPDSAHIVYVKNDRQDYHPLYMVNVKDGVSRLIRTDTKMNHDVACSPDGTIAFRAQVDQWDQIFIAKVKE